MAGVAGVIAGVDGIVASLPLLTADAAGMIAGSW